LITTRFPDFPELSNLSDPSLAKRHYRYSSYVLQVYSLAKRYQEFGLNFKAKHSRTSAPPLLDPDSPYLLGDIAGWETYPSPQLKISEDMLNKLKGYQAPKAI
jgi:hypothetical protein